MWVWAIFSLYLLYALLYILAFARVLDGYAVVAGCLTTHFVGLAFHNLGRQSWVRLGLPLPPVYPRWETLSDALFVWDVLQGVTLLFCVAVLVEWVPRLVETEMFVLIIAYLGVVGCVFKLYFRDINDSRSTKTEAG